ncbi:MAG: hypothetical protein HC848_08680 [Limnobacter sp.]|nr:hypothetical protein [Limnobacter sp.]
MDGVHNPAASMVLQSVKPAHRIQPHNPQENVAMFNQLLYGMKIGMEAGKTSMEARPAEHTEGGNPGLFEATVLDAQRVGESDALLTKAVKTGLYKLRDPDLKNNVQSITETQLAVSLRYTGLSYLAGTSDSVNTEVTALTKGR